MVAPIASLPWKEIIKALPVLIDAGTRLWKRTSSTPRAIHPGDDPRSQLAAVIERLESLESAEAAQAELIKDLLQQLQGITAGLAEVSRRTTLALVIAAIALALAVAGVVLVLVR